MTTTLDDLIKPIRERLEKSKIEIEALSTGAWGIVDTTIEDAEKLLKTTTQGYAALELCQAMMKNIMAKGNIDWGKTFQIDFGLMNEALIAQDKALAEARETLR